MKKLKYPEVWLWKIVYLFQFFTNFFQIKLIFFPIVSLVFKIKEDQG